MKVSFTARSLNSSARQEIAIQAIGACTPISHLANRVEELDHKIRQRRGKWKDEDNHLTLYQKLECVIFLQRIPSKADDFPLLNTAHLHYYPIQKENQRN